MVSVIIPTFNRAYVLERAIRSVQEQTFKDWELIMVDDGSTDSTPELAERFPVRYFKTENRGVSHARNFGASQARGEWLAFLDSDDEWLPRKLELQLPLTSEYQLIHGEENWIRDGKPITPLAKHRKSGGDVFARLVEICCISPSTTMIKRELFEQIGGFREDFPVCEDQELWLRVTHDHQVGFVSEPVQNKYGGAADQLSRLPALDYYRVKALMPFLASRESALVANTILARTEILRKGFKKYPNPEREKEMLECRQAALSALRQNQIVHSATERFPRSLDSSIL